MHSRCSELSTSVRPFFFICFASVLSSKISCTQNECEQTANNNDLHDLILRGFSRGVEAGTGRYFGEVDFCFCHNDEATFACEHLHGMIT
jgi:hypothetical protein